MQTPDKVLLTMYPPTPILSAMIATAREFLDARQGSGERVAAVAVNNLDWEEAKRECLVGEPNDCALNALCGLPVLVSAFVERGKLVPLAWIDVVEIKKEECHMRLPARVSPPPR